VYILSKGSSDILHYVISAIGGPPTALVIRTNKPRGRVQLEIDCKKLASKNESERSEAITMPAGLKEIYSFGLVFSRASIILFVFSLYLNNSPFKFRQHVLFM
jgi:hypothetical protein